MAQNVLVSDELSPMMMQAGEELVKHLDAVGFPVAAAAWVSDEDRWRLVIASPRAAEVGPRQAYAELDEAMHRGSPPERRISLSHITLVDPNAEIIRLLGGLVRTDASIVGVRVTRSMVQGHYIHDSYIYRLAKAA